MITLDSGDKIQGDASAATVVDFTIYGLDNNVLKQLADGQLPSPTIDDLYTADSVDVVTTIILVNTDSAARTVNLYLTPSGGTARRLIPKDLSLGAAYSLHFDGAKVMVMNATGSILQVYSAHKDSHDPEDGADALDCAAPGTNITPEQANDEGSAHSFARSDHMHYIPSGAPSTVAAANSEGTAAAFARSDHIHEREHAKYTNAEAVDAIEADGNLPVASITFIIDGGGSVITTGIKGALEIPFACTINRVTLLGDQAGAIVIDIWKQAYAQYPPENGESITASAPPTISASDTDSQDSTLSGWTTAIAAGDCLIFNVDSVAAFTWITLSLKVTKT